MAILVGSALAAPLRAAAQDAQINGALILDAGAADFDGASAVPVEADSAANASDGASVPVEADSPVDSGRHDESAPPVIAPVDVTVHARGNEGRRLQRSAEAVHVIDLRKARQQTADLGEVLARTQGISVRREGGLGSSARFSLNGLYDEQIRFFVDGVPLTLSGLPLGVQNVPVTLIDRVDVYRGVVPLRLGADALGGAVNLITPQTHENMLTASYQVGSFGTHRTSLSGRYFHEPTGLTLATNAFLDKAKNDYWVDVDWPDESGTRQPLHVKRFHDAYLGYGGSLEVGVVDRPWAKRLVLQGFASTFDKDIQNNLTMTIPYGEVWSSERVFGATARYEVALSKSFEVDALASYAHRAIEYSDEAKWVYDWRGQRVNSRPFGGEINGAPQRNLTFQESAFGRLTLQWTVALGHILRASSSPNFATRDGENERYVPGPVPDAMKARQTLMTLASGIEYELVAWSERLNNMVFVKDYVYRATGQELNRAEFIDYETKMHTLGWGDSVRLTLFRSIYLKSSYEYATRLPTVDEALGNGALVLANYDLKPERGHNLNLGPRAEFKRTGAGDFVLDVNAFYRDVHNLILSVSQGKVSWSENVARARGLGIENGASWVSPGRYVELGATLTWQNLRNVSDGGAFRAAGGDRIPNRPWLFSSWRGNLRFANLPGPEDTFEPFYYGRYVHSFYRGWESLGIREFKQVIPWQLTHAAGISWTLKRDFGELTTTFEVDNLSDAKVFDNFGVQRPGRAFYGKVSGAL